MIRAIVIAAVLAVAGAFGPASRSFRQSTKVEMNMGKQVEILFNILKFRLFKGQL